MKKKILSIALLAVAFAGSSAMAQTQSDNNVCTKEAKECIKKDGKKADKKDRAEFRKGDRKGIRPEMKGERPDPFAGLNLTADQQTKLQELQKNRVAARDKMGKPTKGDTTAMRRNPAEGRRDYLNSVKNILTPEQYVVFLENIVIEQPQGNRHAMQQGMNDGRRAQKMTQKADRTLRQGNKSNVSLSK